MPQCPLVSVAMAAGGALIGGPGGGGLGDRDGHNGRVVNNGGSEFRFEGAKAFWRRRKDDI